MTLHNDGSKAISSKLSTNYTVIFDENGPLGIRVENETSSFYFFDASKGEPTADDNIIKEAFRAILSRDIHDLEIILVSLKSSDRYFNIACEIFKEHWNNLYNSIIADTVFERKISFDTIDKTYDFFEEHKKS